MVMRRLSDSIKFSVLAIQLSHLFVFIFPGVFFFLGGHGYSWIDVYLTGMTWWNWIGEALNSGFTLILSFFITLATTTFTLILFSYLSPPSEKENSESWAGKITWVSLFIFFLLGFLIKGQLPAESPGSVLIVTVIPLFIFGYFSGRISYKILFEMV